MIEAWQCRQLPDCLFSAGTLRFVFSWSNSMKAWPRRSRKSTAKRYPAKIRVSHGSRAAFWGGTTPSAPPQPPPYFVWVGSEVRL